MNNITSIKKLKALTTDFLVFLTLPRLATSLLSKSLIFYVKLETVWLFLIASLPFEDIGYDLS